MRLKTLKNDNFSQKMTCLSSFSLFNFCTALVITCSAQNLCGTVCFTNYIIKYFCMFVVIIYLMYLFIKKFLKFKDVFGLETGIDSFVTLLRSAFSVAR